jgi:hypothetical protein
VPIIMQADDAKIPVSQGDARRLKVPVTDKATGLPADLSAFVIHFALGSLEKDSSQSGVDNSEAAQGVVRVLLTGQETAALPPGPHYWELKADLGGGAGFSRLARGWLVVEEALIKG